MNLKKFFKLILTVFCWVVGIFLLYETIISFNDLDPAGLGFMFFTLPIGIFCIVFLISAINLTKDIIKDKNNENNINKSNKIILILIFGIIIVIIVGLIPYIKYSKIEDEAKLSYTISYNGINCPTPTLYLYSDNTYEYYYTFGTDNEKLIPKTGTYNYDIKKIINNIDKYEENSFGPYSIKEENGKNYTTYNTNAELQELLSSLDITLEKCLEQQ